MVANGGVAVLTGAGISTESGIPDYRGPDGAEVRRAPMTYQTFTRDAAARRRYWARSHVGWRAIARAAPNARPPAGGPGGGGGPPPPPITQNVDGLHQAAGASGVIELHGNLDRVVCLDCGDVTPRDELDRRLRMANPVWNAQVLAVNPDGDVDLPDDAVDRFRVVDCRSCGHGTLKPDVVFFGETVPLPRVEASFAAVHDARLLLVLGSSLTVMSGRRFVLRAAKLGIPVAIVNRGSTRGDDYATLTVDAPLGAVLPEIVRMMR
ncbi:NAD-dependent deacetylase [Micromonospora sp. CPCC 205371]|nr:NAD-dependent deacetylase [Micromonospora sp. CPCC 205371]